MNNDVILVLGVLIGAMAFPSIVSAFSAGRPPRAAIVYFVLGGGLISWVLIRQPNTYSVETFPALVVKVVADIIR